MARQAKKATSRRKPLLGKPERVRHIRHLMANGQWVTGETGEVLAAKWGLNPAIVRGDAAEASRFIRDMVRGDPGTLERIHSTLEAIVADSMKRKRHRDAIEALRVMVGIQEIKRPAEPAEDGGSVTINVNLKPAAAPDVEPCQPSISNSPDPNPEPTS